MYHVCNLNVEGFYDPTLMQLQRCFDDGMLYKQVADVVHSEPDAASALKYIVGVVQQTRIEFADKVKAGVVMTDTVSEELRKKSTL